MQNLHERDSVVIHINTTMRHEQLCRQIKKGDKYIPVISPFRENLEEKYKVLTDAILARVMANDHIRLCDMILDDGLRKTHSRAKEYDRDNPGQKLREILFPGGNLYPVVSMPISEEPAAADQIAKKLESLGSDHPLYFLVEELRTAITACQEAAEAYKEKIVAVADAQTAVELAKHDLRRRYNASYLEAALEFGKDFAEKLFPEIHSSHRIANNIEEETEEDAA